MPAHDTARSSALLRHMLLRTHERYHAAATPAQRAMFCLLMFSIITMFRHADYYYFDAC